MVTIIWLLMGLAPSRGERWQGVGAVLVGADLGQAAVDEGPADAGDGEPGFAGRYDVALGQFPGKSGRVASRSTATGSCIPVGFLVMTCTSGLAGTLCAFRWTLISVTAVKPATTDSPGFDRGSDLSR
jgi:hypothetical protein